VTTSASAKKPRVAVFKLASCDGCQLSLLDCEDELLAVAGAVEIAHFPEASSSFGKGPYDVALVEGSVTTPHDAERIHAIRRQSKLLVAIGACASAGGIQALRNFHDVSEWMRIVYGSPTAIETLGRSTPVRDHVFVDMELRGCPISKEQLVEVLSALLNHRKPVLPTYAVCIDCKRKGVACVLVTKGLPCLGPVTQTGCGALCPSWGRGCFGCFGSAETPNPAALAARLGEDGASERDVTRLFRSFTAGAEIFRRESESHERPH
jgi:coenzyme F420-reducing hydrogenase gamma subunit